MKVILFANTDWYLFNFRLALAKAISSSGHEVLMISPPGAYVEKIMAEGIRWQPLNMRRRSLNPFKEISLVWDLARLVIRERPDCLHAFTLKCVVYGSIVARLFGVKRINALTGMGHVFTNNSIKTRLLRLLIKALLRFSFGGRDVRVIVQNSSDYELLVLGGVVDKSKVKLIAGSGVNTDRFKPLASEINEPIRVVLATRLLWDKGVGEFMQAVRQLRKSGVVADFIVAGSVDSGNPTSVDVRTLAEWESEGIVSFIGHRDDMDQILPLASLVVLPSYREGLPRILIEGAACGLAIVASDVPGCRDVVQHECNGLLVPVKDSVELERAIRTLIFNDDLRKRMGLAGRKRALEEFDEVNINAATMKIYTDLIDG